MKNIGISCIMALIVFSSCANAQSDQDMAFAKIPLPKAGEKVATFAGGCFWAMQECMSEVKGVKKVVSGFAGGTTSNPSYEDVSSRTTGHAESVQVIYDPKVISFKSLVEAFFYAHNPTELNRQGPDVGTDYRSISFYRTPEEKKDIMDVIQKVNASKHYDAKIVTEVTPFKVIYPAENYHQGYYNEHPESRYIQLVSKAKVMKLRKSVPQLIKPEFLKGK